MSKWKQLLWVVCVFFITSAHAQNKPLACQDIESVGLKWEKGVWQPTRFVDKKFILVLNGTNLEIKSAAKVFGDGANASCEIVFLGKVACSDGVGSYLFFDPSTMNGARSHHFGGTQSEVNRDTLTIRAFTCQPF